MRQATPPVAEDLEKMTLPISWRVDGYAAGRAQVAASGTQSLVLNAYPCITSRYSLNEATLRVQNPGTSPLMLTFRSREFVAEVDDAMPVGFTGSNHPDGVALSVDGGTTWYRVADLTGTNATTSCPAKTIDLSQFAAANSLTLSTDVRLTFQQYGRGGSANPTVANRVGRAFDDIAVTSSATPCCHCWPIRRPRPWAAPACRCSMPTPRSISPPGGSGPFRAARRPPPRLGA